MSTSLSAQEFLELAGIETEELLCTLYIPLDSNGVDQKTKKLQLKNSLNRLRSALSARNWQGSKTEKLMSALEGLEGHPLFLDPKAAGLAVLVPTGQPEEMKVMALDFRPEPSVSLGDRYSVAPLLRLFGSSLPRTVLALAKGGLRMLKGTAHHLEPVQLPEEFPKSRDEVIRFEKAAGLDPKHSTQNRTGGNEAQHVRDGGGISPHGEGPKESVDLEFDKRYYRAIGQAMSHMLSQHETILLAGVHEQISLFRKVNPDLPLLLTELTGNFESQPTELFERRALETLAEVERSENALAVAQARELSSDWWTCDSEQAHLAAKAGRIQILFVNSSSLNEPHLEELVLETLRHGGSIRNLDSSELEEACLARFRWSERPDADGVI